MSKDSLAWLNLIANKSPRYPNVIYRRLETVLGKGDYSIAFNDTTIFGVLNEDVSTDDIDMTSGSIQKGIPTGNVGLFLVDAKLLRKVLRSAKKYDRVFLQVEEYKHSTGYRVSVYVDNEYSFGDTSNYTDKTILLETVSLRMCDPRIEGSRFRINVASWYNALMGFDGEVWVSVGTTEVQGQIIFSISDKNTRFAYITGYHSDLELFVWLDRKIYEYLVMEYLQDRVGYKSGIFAKFDNTWAERGSVGRWAQYATLDLEPYINANYLPYTAAYSIANKYIEDRRNRIQAIKDRDPLVIFDDVENSVSIDGKSFKKIGEKNRYRLGCILQDCGYNYFQGIGEKEYLHNPNNPAYSSWQPRYRVATCRDKEA